MVLNTISVGAAVAPTVLETYFSHYLNRTPLRQKPTAHVSYHEGLNLIRQFLHHASYHTVEDIQGFTSQWVPSPRWVKVDDVEIPKESLVKAADALVAQLGHHGVDKVGGSKWWQWRQERSALKAEWIEMRAHYAKRKQSGEKCKRIMLYVHGGAYFFGSVDEHRYQLQRHARKLEARVFARILVTLRDQGFPLPAGAILISPWVDLTHSFPSVAGDDSRDYIPSHGFMQRPSASWPPPNSDDMEQIAMHAVEEAVGAAMPRKSTQHDRKVAQEAAVQGFTVDHHPGNLKPADNLNNPAGAEGAGERPGDTIPGPGHDLSIMLDGKLVTIKDQIQMYASNQLISHPLVSPVLSPTLGGLPPLLVLTGGGELLRDEQIYLAHKAADPSKYSPGEAYLDDYPEARALIQKHKPTHVQLQVWDDLCHVAPTLSFTRPAKYMFRSIAQFGAWALAKAQRTDIEIMDDDDVSIITSGSDTDSSKSSRGNLASKNHAAKNGATAEALVAFESIGKAGEPLPPFKDYMIRQRVNRHGNIYPLDPPSSLFALQMSPNEIGVIKPGPVRKWLEAKKQWDSKFAKEKRKVQKQRIKEMAQGYQGFGDDEVPPPSALAGRRGMNIPKEGIKKRSWGMSLWALWGSKHDESTMQREEKADKQPETITTSGDGTGSIRGNQRRSSKGSKPRSRRRAVSYDEYSTDKAEDIDAKLSAAELFPRLQQQRQMSDSKDRTTDSVDPTFLTLAHSHTTLSKADGGHSEITKNSSHHRPMTNGKLYPFKLGKQSGDEINASTVTLTSQAGIVALKGDENLKQPGEPAVVPLNNGDRHPTNTPDNDEAPSIRPGIERFETAKESI